MGRLAAREVLDWQQASELDLQQLLPTSQPISRVNSLEIGDNSIFGERVSIHDENHVIGCGPEPIASRGWETAPIVIGKNVWVGSKATILQGVRIGDNAVIGANAVVTRDVPANSVAVGIPARVIRQIDPA